MTRVKVTVLLIAMSVVAISMSVAALSMSVAAISGQRKPVAVVPPSDLAGTWTLNRGLSQFPREVGFGMDVVPTGRTDTDELAGAAAEGRSGNPKSLTAKPQSEEEARNQRQLVDEVKNPPTRLTIVQTASSVTITDARGRSRTFHPDGREEAQTLDAGPITSMARWDGARLVVRYRVESGREVRYGFVRKADPPQLVVQSELIERGGHDTVTRIYEPATAAELAAPPEAAPADRAPLPMLPSQSGAARPGSPAGQATGGQPAGAPPVGGMVPVVPRSASSGPLDQRPGAELMGLAALGVVVEGLGPEAAHCGLKQDAIESTVTKSLSDAGLKVLRNSDEDSYLYINVITTAMSTGFCFSRYDAYIYSNTTATLSYGSRPTLVQVELMRKGGLTGSGAGSHGEAVVKTLKQYVDQFAARIREVNK